MIEKFVLLCIIGLALVPTAIGENGQHDVFPAHRYSFDRDGDRIDDILQGDDEFHVIIHIEGDVDPSERLEDAGVMITHTFPRINALSALIPSREILMIVSSMPEVKVIEAQRALPLMMTVSVPATKSSPSDTYPSKSAHDLGFKGDGITIAVVDSGVDNEHPMLKGSFVAGADFTIPSMNRDGTTDPDDRLGHGTAVASIALGREHNGTSGVAPRAGLIDLKVTTGLDMDVNPITDELLLSIQWCIDNSDTDWNDRYSGVNVVLISSGIGPGDGALASAIDVARSSGIVVIQPAGNSGTGYEDQTENSWPDGSIVAGGLDHMGTVERSDDEYWELSTSGPRTDDGDNDRLDELKPDITAPAVGISFASFSRTSTIQPATGMSQGSGTSLAASHVAGTVALMMQANPAIAPTEKSHPVMKILHSSSESKGNPTFPLISSSYNANYGWGMLDSYQAVLASISYTGRNHRPEIVSFTAEPSITTTGSLVKLMVMATDFDEDPLKYELKIDAGEYTGEGPIWEWTAPGTPGNYSFLATVSDPAGLRDQLKTFVEVIEGSPNRPPVITSFNADDGTLNPGESTRIITVAFDQDDDPLEYHYDTILGSVSGNGEEVTYTAPMITGTDTVSVRVTDPQGGSDRKELTISIRSDSTNSPPIISLLRIDPPVYNSSTTRRDVILSARVQDPDGPNDISLVYADLSSLGGSTGEVMADDGQYPDNTSSDGIYSLIVPLSDPLINGIFTIYVTAVDNSGEESTESIDLEVSIESSGDTTSGTSSSTDITMIVIVLTLVIVLLIVTISILISRSRRKREKVSDPGARNMAKVRYRQSMINQPQQTIHAGPPQNPQPKFNVVSGP